ncbi:uncharacterized protein LOC133711573 [Rosa rugosa]|uniref:uncharacterized protein LOC133711573 n=1 Tax=Rosa rugosa TaxID=74645 RepID=UPI002B4032F8|nr:uncharacterized protein LOC133711573 [Rosa rugosa]
MALEDQEKQRSFQNEACIAIRSCSLASPMPARPIRGSSTECSKIYLEIPWKFTLMTWWLKASIRKIDHIEHLREAFEILRQYGMRLNPTKCAFGVSSGQFLGHLVSKRGIEPNLEKVEAIVKMRDPETKEDIQVLTGRIAALSRFISRLTDRCKPFFRALKNKQANFWGPEQSEALANLKKYLSGRQFLSVPRNGEPLCIYLAISDVATSAALFREEGYRQEPIAYKNRRLLDAETRYSPSEKVILALVTAKRKLRQYFEGHSITVYTNLPIRAILSKLDTSGRMAKWAIELSEFDITYKPRSALKGQALADFLVECHFPAPIPEVSWNHGRTHPGRCTSTAHPVSQEQGQAFYFKVPRMSKSSVYSDSQLVVGLSNDDYAANDERMSRYQDLVRDLMRGFKQLSLVKVPREKNSRVDELAKAASGCTEVINIVKIEVLEGPSIDGNKPRRQVMVVESIPNDWRGQIINYLEFGIQPDDPIEARKLRMKAARYLVVKEELFRRSFSGPHLRCLGPSQARLVLEEVHEGSCGAHLGGRTLAHKVLSQGYYWPYLSREAEQYAKKCKQCQRHAPVSHSPAEELHSLAGPWPFARWGMDIVGLLPTAPGGLKYALLATDYHTKWVEADSYAMITGETVATFTWRNIICRFGIPRYIICDNGTQFNNQKFRAFYTRHGITLRFSSRSYPQGNGQAEITNRTIFDGVKRRLEHKRGKWSEELQHVLWAYRTTRRKPTDETPYALTNGMEAVISTEIILPTVRTLTVERGNNEEQIARHLDLLDERREAAAIHLANYQNQVAKYFNKGVRPRAFLVGELVL